MRLFRILAVGAMTALPGMLEGQARAGEFLISPRGGYLRFDRATSIQPNAFLGIDVQYHLSPMFSIGPTMTVARTNTRGEDFLAAMTYGFPTDGDTTFYYRVTQPVTIVDFALNGTARFGIGRASPFLTAGVGAYSLYLDPQVSNGASRITRMSLNVGGGFNMQLSENAGVFVDVRDLIFTGYERDRLNPTEPRFRFNRFSEDFAVPPASRKTLHNITVALGFSFAPRRDDTAEVGR